MMEIFRVLDDMESMLKDGKKLPLSSGKNIIDSNDFLERIDRLRAILPEEIETARLVISEKERIIKEAYGQADQYVHESRHKVARMVDDNEITRNAVKMAEEIVQRAEEVAADLRRDANQYAEQILAHIEMVLNRSLDTIVSGQEELRQEIDKASI
ncbi:MAG: hypothetical protein GX119_04375 [Syntrophomonadaceae bacterium]|jgi:ElaB/YqjD/DUF883 family membrane-anchored ribosome-binding protein|nr:hypothetical protein [Syntrophomonadaceae bacterium]